MDPYQSAAPLEAQPRPSNDWQSRLKKALGPLAAVGILIVKFFAKLKFFILPLLKFFPIILKSGGTMLFSIWAYAIFFGWQFAVGFVVLIFVHECGHLIVAKRFGLKVSAPVFIPFMGAFILLKDQPRNAWMEACVGIGGPMLGSLGALLAHCARSLRGSFAREYTLASRRRRWPGSRRVGLGETSIRAAAPGTIDTSKRWTTGFSPGTSAIAATGNVPVRLAGLAFFRFRIPAASTRRDWNAMGTNWP